MENRIDIFENPATTTYPPAMRISAATLRKITAQALTSALYMPVKNDAGVVRARKDDGWRSEPGFPPAIFRPLGLTQGPARNGESSRWIFDRPRSS